MRPPSRRGLLGGSLATAALLSLGGGVHPFVRRAMAQDTGYDDQHFIFCYFDGGWDLLLSLDPRDPDVFRDDLKKETRIQCGYDEISSSYGGLVEPIPGMVLGPTVGDLSSVAQDLCIVRGMSMDTLTHEVGRRRMITGHAPAGLQAQGSAIATVLAALLGSNEPIPQLSVGVESYNDGFDSWASAIRVSSVDDLVRVLKPSDSALSSAEQDAVDSLLAELQSCPVNADSSFRKLAYDSREAAQALVALGLDEQFNFGASTSEMSALRERYGIGSDMTTPAAQAAAAVTAITAGISRCVCVNAAESLDTHGPEWASSHPRELKSGFDLVAAMITDLDSRSHPNGGTWLDRTTVVAFSEFGRSTLLNSSGGRDHFLHNACMLAGGLAARGAVVGASSDVGMNPQAMDLSTGELSDAGETVRPEHLWRALLEGVGEPDDVADLGVDPLTAALG